MKYLAYFAFLVSLLSAINPFWRNRISICDAGSKIITLQDVSELKFNSPLWQSILFISLIGFIFGLSAGFHTEAPNKKLIFIGVLFTWLLFFLNFFSLIIRVRCNGVKNESRKFFNALAASWMAIGLSISGLTIITPGGLPFLNLAIPLLMYYIFICSRSISTIVPDLSINRAIIGELITLTLSLACVGGLTYLFGFDVLSFLMPDK